MRAAVFALMLFACSPLRAAWMSSGAATPPSPPTDVGGWRKIQFSYADPNIQPTYLDAQVLTTWTLHAWQIDSNNSDGNRAVADSGNGDAVWAAGVSQEMLFVLHHYHESRPPDHMHPQPPSSVDPEYLYVPFYAGLNSTNPISIEWGTYTPGNKLQGSIAVKYNGVPTTWQTIAAPEPASAWLLLLGVAATARPIRPPAGRAARIGRLG